MRKKLHLFLFMLLVSSNLSIGENINKTKDIKDSHKILHKNHLKTKTNVDRNKRSLDNGDEKPFWGNRGKKESEENYIDNDKLEQVVNRISKNDKILKDPPFWGNRGRRDSASIENEIDNINYARSESESQPFDKNCKYCNGPLFTRHINENFKDRKDELSPFWGNRGRRNSEETEMPDDIQVSGPFWGNRGRRQEEDPFWGARGRRQEPYWANRGRRDELPFWGNRGRLGKLKGLKNWDEGEDEPFWGNRGRRRNLKNTLREAIDDDKEEFLNLYENRGNSLLIPNSGTTFWNNQGRDSSLKHLFTGQPRYKYDVLQPTIKALKDINPNSVSKSVTDSRMYAEEPHYIIVERSSRSSGEFDPYFISRGKKITLIEKAARNRRGSIEDMVKSVKNDPYFIVRGKKYNAENDTKADNSNALHNKYAKAKELICATVAIMLLKKEGTKNKREAPDNDRGRRAILNKLAAQLQIDPYFVSRGKKNNNWTNEDEYLAEFLDQIQEMCT